MTPNEMTPDLQHVLERVQTTGQLLEQSRPDSRINARTLLGRTANARWRHAIDLHRQSREVLDMLLCPELYASGSDMRDPDGEAYLDRYITAASETLTEHRASVERALNPPAPKIKAA